MSVRERERERDECCVNKWPMKGKNTAPKCFCGPEYS